MDCFVFLNENGRIDFDGRETIFSKSPGNLLMLTIKQNINKIIDFPVFLAPKIFDFPTSGTSTWSKKIRGNKNRTIL